MNHLDLFSGIGGFALAAQAVWGEDYRCVGFCEIDPFCQQVLRKNFEGVTIYGDIRGLTAERLIADTKCKSCPIGRQPFSSSCQECAEHYYYPEERSIGNAESGTSQAVGTICGGQDSDSAGSVGDARPLRIDLLTGGFPCQPFSTAGKRKGTEDDRFLWPEMLRVIRETKPRWIIGENVAGIIEMALGQVCSELESLDYEVQCFVIPACAVNAPHRRDRVWIVAHSKREGLQGYLQQPAEYAGTPCRCDESCPSPDTSDLLCDGSDGDERECERSEAVSQSGDGGGKEPSSDTSGTRLEGVADARDAGGSREASEQRSGKFPESRTFPDWSRDWCEVAFESCVRGVDDGLPRRVARLPDGSTISESRWRQNSLKAYGNAIVPQVAMEIMRVIREVDHER